MQLDQLIAGSLFAFLMVFMRVGAAMLVMPGFGEPFVSTRIRLLFALGVSYLLMPVLLSSMPPRPATVGGMLTLILAETLTGLFLGTIARMLMSSLETAGMLIANQVGLSAAQSFNPAQATSGNALSSLLSMLALVLIFATDLHHMLLLAIVDSYSLFAPGVWLPVDDAAQHMTRVMADSFLIGMQLAAPFTVIGLVFYLGLGLIARLVPQIQVFFVGMPLQIIFGLLLLGLSLSALMVFWLARFEGHLINILQP
jgi:flagellar biosynthetic protein FliR